MADDFRHYAYYDSLRAATRYFADYAIDDRLSFHAGQAVFFGFLQARRRLRHYFHRQNIGLTLISASSAIDYRISQPPASFSPLSASWLIRAAAMLLAAELIISPPFRRRHFAADATTPRRRHYAS